MKSFTYFRFLVMISILAFLTACQGSKRSSSPAAPALPPYCSSTTNYPQNSVVISGRALYQYRELDTGTVVSVPKPIREAELRVVNANGATIQCGRTDNSGLFSLTLPQGSGLFYVYVNSRADHELLKAYVMTDPTSNSYYSVSLSFTPDSTKNIGDVIAPATASLEGGAFNILDQLLSANKYLTTQTANCGAVIGNCSPFTANSSLLTRVYWKKGLNPAAAYYNTFSPVSFYLPGKHELYILGGENGDVDNTDTDHFDNSVIIHEYGHYIEDLFIRSDSQGGSHNGNQIIDPRLAWSEGFANFFQAAVTGEPLYRDTIGTAEGGYFHYGYNEYIASYNGHSPTRDIASIMGEGNFREFSVTRSLWEVTQNTSTFGEFWAVASNVNIGFKNSLYSFRASGLLFESQNTLNYSSWGSVLTSEKQLPNRKDFANPLQPGTGCTMVLTDSDRSDVNSSTAFTSSNLFVSNDFYAYHHSGGAIDLRVTYSTSSTGGADIDLYLLKSDFTFGDEADILGASEKNVSDPTYATERIVLPNVSAGTYMIDAKLFTGTGSPRNYGGFMQPATYRIYINNTEYCPTF